MLAPVNAQTTSLTSIFYNQDELKQTAPEDPSQATPGENGVVWLDIVGLKNIELIRSLKSTHGIHHLLLEDIVHVPQRPKLQSYPGLESVILRMNRVEGDEVVTEQITIVWGDGFVVTVQEQEGDTFAPIRTRLKSGAPIRSKGPDYLAYALVDTVIDHYFSVLEFMSQKLDLLDAVALDAPGPGFLKDVQAIKKDLIEERTNLWATREALSEMLKLESVLMTDDTKLHLRDCQDHCKQLLEHLDSLRDTSSNLIDLYLSGVAHKTNEVMQHLTLIATIFIPLSFLAGVFGMNFEYMPELKWRWSYPIFWVAVVAIATGMTRYFLKRGWLKISP